MHLHIVTYRLLYYVSQIPCLCSSAFIGEYLVYLSHNLSFQQHDPGTLFGKLWDSDTSLPQ